MKYLMNMSLNLTSRLEDENWRGEGRWECNVLNALLKEGKQVHTTRHFWRSPEPMPPNLYSGTNEDWVGESVLLVHGAGRSLYIERDDCRGYIVNFHELPFGQAEEDLRKYMNQDRIIATLASRNPFTYNRLHAVSGERGVRHVAGAMVPYVVRGADNFRKNNVTWVYRNFRDFLEEKPEDLVRLFAFLRPILALEGDLRIAIIVGVWDTVRFGTRPASSEIRDWVLKFPVMEGCRDLWDRIDFYVNLHWKDVLALLGETRWIISPAEPLGCPPYEAAMYGIPTIVNCNVNPFMALEGGYLFPELLVSSRSIDSSFLGLLARLQNEHAFYRKTGDAYRNYTAAHATFSAFVRELDMIVEEKGWA